jgi:hypothetical protein
VRVTSAGVTPLDRTVPAGARVLFFAGSGGVTENGTFAEMTSVPSGHHDRSFPLEQAPEAPRHLIEDRPFGTVTLTVGS